MANNNYEKPTIELFMYSLHQEFPEGISHESFTRSNVQTRDILAGMGERMREFKQMNETMGRQQQDWPAQWLHAQWITDHVKSISNIFEDRDTSPIKMALTREEDFGGIIYDPFSDKVYKVNKSGYNFFKSLQAAVKEGANIEEYTAEGYEDQDVAEFKAFLRGAGLWER